MVVHEPGDLLAVGASHEDTIGRPGFPGLWILGSR